MASAISAGSARRPCGVGPMMALNAPSSPPAFFTTASHHGCFSQIAVFTPPGCTELTLMPSLAHSSAIDLVKRRTPPLLAQYALAPGAPTIPIAEDTFTIEPPRPAAR